MKGNGTMARRDFLRNAAMLAGAGVTARLCERVHVKRHDDLT